EDWIILRNAHPALVDRQLFDKVQATRRQYIKRSREKMLEDLKNLWKEKGHLDWNVLKRTKGIASYLTYVRHFGGMAHIYSLINRYPKHARRQEEYLLGMTEPQNPTMRQLVAKLADQGWSARWRRGRIEIGGLKLMILPLKPGSMQNTESRWMLNLRRNSAFDLLLAIRLNSDNVP